MQIHLHQTHHTVADFHAIGLDLKHRVEKSEGLHLFPELYLTGYPLQDLCLQRSFILAHQKHLQDLHDWAKKLDPKLKMRALMGGLSYTLTSDGLPQTIRNVIYELTPGTGLKDIYTKRLLPNYDIFDEQKYFTAGTQPLTWSWDNKTFGLLICEDMWVSSMHHVDPCQDLLEVCQKNGTQLHAIINLSASPYDWGKHGRRIKRAQVLSHQFKTPFIYVNRVGGEDEVLFDGQSFLQDGESTLKQAQEFKAETITTMLPEKKGPYQPVTTQAKENTWEGLFAPRLQGNKLTTWTDQHCESVLKALIFAMQEYAHKNGFSRFLVALSGGIDSALVLTILKLGLKDGQALESIYMPSIFSSGLSWELSAKLCQNLGIPLKSMPIKFLHSTIKSTFGQTFNEPFAGLTDENVQSRLRGLLLYTRSNQTGAMVVNTSNKSELAVGYSTQYGDSVGALSLLGDLYKTEVYRLCEYINAHYNNPIPQGIIERGPSAELRENQLDQDSLPPYERLDAMLEAILCHRAGVSDLTSMGFSTEEAKKVFHLWSKAEYKRSQFCPIVKIKAKSFGFGHRVPISKKTDFYFET